MGKFYLKVITNEREIPFTDNDIKTIRNFCIKLALVLIVILILITTLFNQVNKFMENERIKYKVKCNMYFEDQLYSFSSNESSSSYMSSPYESDS